MKIKSVIFDMDGVLIDAREWHYDSLNKALSLFGCEITRHDHLITFDGLPTKKKLEILSLEGGLPRKLHNFINDLKQEFTWETIYTKCKPIFHHRYALSKLKSEGYLICVCSNSVRKSVEMMMSHSGLDSYLDFYLSNQDVQKGKPDPEMYIKAIQKLGVTPSECLIIEDNPNGIKAAIASGAHLLRVNSPDDVTYISILKRIKDIEHA